MVTDRQWKLVSKTNEIWWCNFSVILLSSCPVIIQLIYHDINNKHHVYLDCCKVLRNVDFIESGNIEVRLFLF
jgi:hypothetical protein